MIEKLEKLVKEKYNKELSELNCKSLMNIVRHNGLMNELYEKTNTQNMGEGLYLLLNNIQEKPKCISCNKEVKFINFTLGYHKYCSNKCMSNSEEVKNKINSTNLEKYGTKYFFQSKDFQDKSKLTLLKNYGVDNISKNKEMMNIITTNRVKSYMNNFINNLFDGNRLNSLVKPLFTKDEYLRNYNKYKWQCIKCNTIFIDVLPNQIPRCPKCYPMRISSINENKISEWLESLNIKVIKRTKSIISPLELDIYLPDYNIAIEFNGIYWHSELSGGKDKNYHLNKTNLCKEKGIDLIHIFEDEWIYKQEIIKSIILSKLGIYKKKILIKNCKIRELKYVEVSKFLEDNHIQGTIKSSINIGLFQFGKLVSLATFNHLRYRKDNSYELLRFCSKLNIQIVGGLEYLIDYFKNKYIVNKIILNLDKRFNSIDDRNIIGETLPSYSYFKKDKRESKNKFQKSKLEKLLTYYDSNLTEWQNMQLNGYDRIWDCGNYIVEI